MSPVTPGAGSLVSIVYNGMPMEIPIGTTLVSLLQMRQVRTELVAVEINLEIVPRHRHAETVINPGDSVEVVTLVGGG